MTKTPIKLDKLEALFQINESILSILETDKLLTRILDIMEHTFGFDSCAILFLDDKAGELYIRAARGYSAEAVQKFRTTIGGRGITGHVAGSREPLFISDIEKDSRYVSGVDGSMSEIALPLLVDDRLLGVLDIESKERYSFSDHDFDTLTVFASQIALAISNAICFESERRHSSQLLVFNEIRKRISLNLELDRLLDVVAGSVIEFLNYREILVFLKHEDADQLSLAARAGNEGASTEEVVTIGQRRIVDQAFEDNATVNVRDVEASPTDDSPVEGIGAELAIPLTIQRKTVGVIYIASRNRGAFDDRDLHILETICDQLTIVMKDASAFANISKKSKHVEIISKINQVAIQTFDLHKFIDEIARLIQEVFGFYSVSVFSFEDVEERLELLAFAGAELRSLEVGDKMLLADGIVGHAARTREAALCNDVVGEGQYQDILINTKSELAVPIVRGDKLFGVINIESTRLNQFDQNDIEIFSRIADQIAYTITNAELFRQKTTAHSLLLSLNDLSRQINSTFDLESTLESVVRELPSIVNCRLCSIFFFDEVRKELILERHNLPTSIDSSGPISLNAPNNELMARVIELKRSVHVQNIEQELHVPNKPRYQTKSFLNIILLSNDRILGVLNLTDKLDGGYFSSEEFYLVNSFAEHLANAVANAERYQKILELSVTDGLTGLYVHRYFQNALAREIARTSRHGLPLSLVMLDVDDFKLFNDTYGHQVGDIVLREIALLVKAQAREYDIATRYGGEEFAIILPSTSLAQARDFAERLRASVESAVIVSSRPELRITISQGVSEFETDCGKDDLIRRADLALLEAKRAGKNRVMTHGWSEA